MINIFKFFSIFITFIFFKSLLEWSFGKKNYIYQLFEEIKKIKKKRKFLFNLFIFLPMYIIWILFEIINKCVLLLCIFLCLPYNIDIKPKNTEYDLINFCDSNWKIKKIFITILKENFKISYNRNFSTIYKIIGKKNRQNYINSIEMLGFKKITGVSLQYVLFIIKITNSQKNNVIKKVWHIRAKIYIRKFFLNILWNLNENYFEKIIVNLETIKIKINFFKVEINGSKNSKSIADNFRKAGVLDCKFLGQYKEIKNKSIPHILIEIEKNNNKLEKKEKIIASLTTKKNVNVWDKDGVKEQIETLDCGKTNSNKKQYALPLEIGENFKERYELQENFEKNVIIKFNIETKNEFLGKIIQVAANLKNSDIKEGILRDLNNKKININSESEKSLNNENLDIINWTSHRKIGEEAYKNLNMNEKFNIQNEFYNKVEKTKKDENYYDIE